MQVAKKIVNFWHVFNLESKKVKKLTVLRAEIVAHSRFIYEQKHIWVWRKSVVRLFQGRIQGRGGKSFLGQKMTKVMTFFGGEGGTFFFLKIRSICDIFLIGSYNKS